MESKYPVMKKMNQQLIALVANQHLIIERGIQTDILNIVGSDGKLTLSIEITSKGSILKIEGASLAIQATGDLAIEADKVAVHGRTGLSLSTNGDVRIQASGNLYSTAKIQKITAELGDIDVKANDDVKIDGERIRMNC